MKNGKSPHETKTKGDVNIVGAQKEHTRVTRAHPNKKDPLCDAYIIRLTMGPRMI